VTRPLPSLGWLFPAAIGPSICEATVGASNPVPSRRRQTYPQGRRRKRERRLHGTVSRMVDPVPRIKLKRASHESLPACCDRSRIRRHFQRPHAVRRRAYRNPALGDRISTRFAVSVLSRALVRAQRSRCGNEPKPRMRSRAGEKAKLPRSLKRTIAVPMVGLVEARSLAGYWRISRAPSRHEIRRSSFTGLVRKASAPPSKAAVRMCSSG